MRPDADVIFYDGVCGFCDRFVQFVLARDRPGRFRFAPLQGALAARELPARGGRPDDLDTVYVLTGDGRLLRKSRAVLYVLQRLGGAWGAFAVLRVIPAWLADPAYDLLARLRYRLFGRFDACRIPSGADRGRFLERDKVDIDDQVAQGTRVRSPQNLPPPDNLCLAQTRATRRGGHVGAPSTLNLKAAPVEAGQPRRR